MLRRILVLLVIIAAVSGTEKLKNGYRIKFAATGTPGETRFFEAPRTVAEACAANWTLTARPPGPLPQLLMYCYRNKVVCAFMDDTGNIAGFQVGLRKDKISNNVFDPCKRGFTSWTTDVDGVATEFWTLQQYYGSEEYYKQDKIKRNELRNDNRILQEGAVYLTGFDGEILKVSASEDEVKDSIFTLQGCYPQMGTHYFYNYTTRTECVAEQMYPWFVIMFEKQMVCTGFLTFLDLELDTNERDWFERPDTNTIKAIAPHVSHCAYEIPVVTMHICYVDNPWDITCPTT